MPLLTREEEKKIVSLERPDDLVHDTLSMLQIAVEFYKQLFGREEKLDINLDENFWEPENLVTEEENNLLDQEF